MSISERFVFSAPVMAMLVLAGCAPSAPPAKERVVEVETIEIAPDAGGKLVGVNRPRARGAALLAKAAEVTEILDDAQP